MKPSIIHAMCEFLNDLNRGIIAESRNYAAFVDPITNSASALIRKLCACPGTSD